MDMTRRETEKDSPHRKRQLERLEAMKFRRETEKAMWEHRAAQGRPEALHFVRLKSHEIGTIEKRISVLKGENHA